MLYPSYQKPVEVLGVANATVSGVFLHLTAAARIKVEPNFFLLRRLEPLARVGQTHYVRNIQH
jgi:hypothetical protein